MTQSPDSLLKHFSLIPDFRVAGRTDHKLFDILFIAVAACIPSAQIPIILEESGKSGTIRPLQENGFSFAEIENSVYIDN